MNEGMKEWRNEWMKEWRNEGMKEWRNESINQSIIYNNLDIDIDVEWNGQ